MFKFKQLYCTSLMAAILMLSLPAYTHAYTHKTTIPVTKTVNKLKTLTNEIDPQVLKLAIKAYNNAQREGLVKNHKLMVVDFSLPSNQKRMWVFNLDRGTLEFDTYVTHGINTGNRKARHFSNQNGSKQSSIGTFVTGDTYYGSNGLSLNLQGMDKGLNDNAFARRIVIHGANYADASVINKNGRLGRSWGCFAVSPKISGEVINELKNGSVVFAYYPEQKLLHSKYLA